MQLSGAQAYIDEMQARIDSVLDPIVPNKPYALLDFPDIRNVGDSAIWLGEMGYFERKGHGPPAYVSTMGNLDSAALEHRVPDGPIFLHGGGNFGDIWRGHQVFREKIIQRWPNRLIIQLPQSIYFGSPERIESSARIINAHKNFILLVRDRESQAFADEHLKCTTILCPDMAFYVGAIAPSQPAEFPILAMLRTDKERLVSRSENHIGVPVEDWITENENLVRIAKAKGLLGALRALDVGRIRGAMYLAAAKQRVFERGVPQLSRGKVIVTDRLHVHILSLLLGKTHSVLDNSYNKIGRFRAAFPEPVGLTHEAASLAEAMDWARRTIGGE